MYPDCAELEYIEDEAYFHPGAWHYLNHALPFRDLLALQQRLVSTPAINWAADLTRSEQRARVARLVARSAAVLAQEQTP